MNAAAINTLSAEDIEIGISCDGIPENQNAHRKYADGCPSSGDVEKALRIAVRKVPSVMVNAVYGPDTIACLADTVSWFYKLGVRNIFLNPDYRAPWKEKDIKAMRNSYAAVADLYWTYRLSGDQAVVNLIDTKLTVLLNGGYAVHERCSMGKREFAFSPEGNIYPCERLANDGLDDRHLPGNVHSGVETINRCIRKNPEDGTPCSDFSIRDYCMHWCGCSNYFSTGSYDSPGAFLCVSEKEAINQACGIIEYMAE